MADSEHSEFREDLHQGEHPATYDHTEPQYSIIAILGGLTIVSLFLVGIGIEFYYDRMVSSAVYDKVLSQPNWALQDLRNKEAWELTHYARLDPAKGTVRLPVDQAMQILVREAAENRLRYPTAPYAVKTPEQLSAPAVSTPGAAAVESAQNSGVVSSPNVQSSSVPQQPHR